MTSSHAPPPGSMLLRAARDGERASLLAPSPGVFTCARARGDVLVPGQVAGVLRVLGRSHPLVVPDGVAGRVANKRPERVHEPVEWGQVLYELEPLGAAAALVEEAHATSEQGHVVRSPQPGRFWQRASPADPPLAAVGAVLEDGSAVGLIEVMKTFTHVVYRASDGLPARARVAELRVEDGAEVAAGDPLLRVEPA